jgi:regulator of sirC expression with transglutaminase-like and TPR domain
LDPGLLAFARVVDCPDDDIDLGVAALLIAAHEQPAVDVAREVDRLDAMAAAVRARPGDRVDALVGHLFDDLGLRGNLVDYYDPQNSFLDRVLARGLGIPITLSVVTMEVGRRAGIDVRGIGFPGHFLVRAGDRILDPFHRGVTLDRDDLELRLQAVAGPGADLEAALAETSKRDILARMLNNLRGIYARRGDAARERGIVALASALSGGTRTDRTRN